MAHGDPQLAANCCFVFSDVRFPGGAAISSGKARKDAEVENELYRMKLIALQFSFAPGRTSGEVSELQ